MKHKFKIGDIVRCISNDPYDKHCKNKIGKIIEVDNYIFPLFYLIEFFEPIQGGHAGFNEIGKKGYCWNLEKYKIELYKQPILKIFLKEKELNK